MTDVLGWATIVVVLAVPVIIAVSGFVSRRAAHLGEGPASGGLLGFDELFHPSAHDARVQWEAEQELPAPAPTPDRGPGVIETGGRIVIEVDAPAPHTPHA